MKRAFWHIKRENIFLLKTFVIIISKQKCMNLIASYPPQLPPGLVRLGDDHQPGPGADHFATLRGHQPGRDSNYERTDQLTVGWWWRRRQRQQRLVLILARFDYNNLPPFPSSHRFSHRVEEMVTNYTESSNEDSATGCGRMRN